MNTPCHRSAQTADFSQSAQSYKTKGISLQCGDVLQLAQALPPNSIDAVIADPPYCSGAGTAAGTKQDPVNKYCHDGNACGRPTFTGDARDQRSFKYWCTLWLSACRRASKESAYCLSFIDWRQLPIMTDAIQAAGWTWRGVIAWDKGRGSRAPHKGFFRHQCEYIVWATNGKVAKRTDAGPFDGCYHVTVKQKDKHHITGKPTDLMRQLVQIAPERGTILDPFAGSATMGVAAKLEKRNFIGFELSEEYFEIGKQRLQAN